MWPPGKKERRPESFDRGTRNALMLIVKSWDAARSLAADKARKQLPLINTRITSFLSCVSIE